jgi:hypothetical protein
MAEIPWKRFLYGAHKLVYVLLSQERYMVPVMMLVDSGADISMIPKTIGDQLGFRLERGEMVYTVGGIGGGIPVVYRSVFLTVGEDSFPTISLSYETR